MTKEKRKPRAYKIDDTNYNKAMKRAAKEGGKLAVHIEHWVKAYGEGLKVSVKYLQSKK